MLRRWRLILSILAGLALTAVLVVVAVIYLLLQPDRFTAMLQSQAQAAGLELNLASPASPTLFPRPAIYLTGITINAQNANAPILLAARGELALSWRTLFGGPTVISQLQIDAPRVDLAALQAWLASLPVEPNAVPTNIPRIDTGVTIVRGSIVRGDQLLLGNLSIEAGSLLSGKPFPLSLAATTATGIPLQLQLSATPRIHENSLQLDDVALSVSQGNSLALTLNGRARWHGAADASADLAGKLDQPNVGQYAISLQLSPADQTNPLLLALKLDGPNNHVDLRLPPLGLIQWWNSLCTSQIKSLSLPPASGHLEVTRFTTAGVTVDGLTLDAGDNVLAPAAASTVTKPAAGTVAPRKKP